MSEISNEGRTVVERWFKIPCRWAFFGLLEFCRRNSSSTHSLLCVTFSVDRCSYPSSMNKQSITPWQRLFHVMRTKILSSEVAWRLTIPVFFKQAPWWWWRNRWNRHRDGFIFPGTTTPGMVMTQQITLIDRGTKNNLRFPSYWFDACYIEFIWKQHHSVF